MLSGETEDLSSKQILIKAATKVFAEKGYEGATVKDIAETAGSNISMISYYFKGKEGIYRACLEKFGKEEFSAATRVLSTAESKEDFKLRLKLFAEEFVRAHIDNIDICKIIHRDFDNRNPITLDVFIKVFVPSFLKVVEFLKQAQRNKLLRSDLDPNETAGLMFGGLVNMIRMDPIRKMVFNNSLHDKAVCNNMICNFLKNNFEGIIEG